jgi:hypothetical protein
MYDDDREIVETKQFQQSGSRIALATNCDPSMKGDAAMKLGMSVAVLMIGLLGLEICQWHIGIPLMVVWTLLIGLLGFVWAIAFNTYTDN